MGTATPNPFRGVVVWLTQDQGGRVSGPPRSPYAATAYVPPTTAQTGLASFVLDGFEAAAWRSASDGRWLAVENEWPHHVEPGSVVVITEGPKPIGYFHVDQVVSDGPERRSTAVQQQSAAALTAEPDRERPRERA